MSERSRLNSISGRDPATGAHITIRYAEGLIREIVPAQADDDGEGLWLAPGLVDIQVNGYEGVDLNDGVLEPATVIALAQRLQRVGVASFLPTLITAGEDDIVQGLQAIAQAHRQDPVVGRMIAGVHVEGPSLSDEPGPRGAHPGQHIRPPDLAEFRRWQQACGGIVSMLTISPHWDNSAEFIAALVADGIHVAIGHTHASVEQIRAAADAGASLSTHLGNGAHGNLRRHPNYLWTQLADDRLSASFIADGHHLPADTLKVMLRAKGAERSILVSDTVALGGMPPGTYEHLIGGTVRVDANGRLSVAGTEFLAGAGLPLLAGIAHAVNRIGVPLAAALQMATSNPGRFAGGRGVLAIGADADLLRFAWDGPGQPLRAETLVIAGATVLGPD